MNHYSEFLCIQVPVGWCLLAWMSVFVSENELTHFMTFCPWVLTSGYAGICNDVISGAETTNELPFLVKETRVRCGNVLRLRRSSSGVATSHHLEDGEQEEAKTDKWRGRGEEEGWRGGGQEKGGEEEEEAKKKDEEEVKRKRRKRRRRWKIWSE